MNGSIFNALRLAALACAAALLSGCGSIPMGAPQASIEGIQAVRSARIPPLAVKRFSASPKLPANADASVSVRAPNLVPPKGSFATYLQETIEAELAGAGALDPNSGLVLEGELTDRQLDPAIGTGKGQLAARFVLKSGGTTVYDQEKTVTASWDSSFVGAVAIPAAVNEFTTLFRKLGNALFTDAEFQRAVSSPSK